jgi:hypothetical protein
MDLWWPKLCIATRYTTVTSQQNHLSDIVILFSGSAAQHRLWPRSRGFLITHDAPQSEGLLWTSDQLVAETSTSDNTQQTNLHAPGGIRNHDRSRRAAVDLRLRLRGHWDWNLSEITRPNIGFHYAAYSPNREVFPKKRRQ